MNGPEQAQEVHPATQGKDSVSCRGCRRHQPLYRTAGCGHRECQVRAALMTSLRARADKRPAGGTKRRARLFAGAAENPAHLFTDLIEAATLAWRQGQWGSLRECTRVLIIPNLRLNK